ncbi:zinc-binding dehydrogenase [Yinghuangia soli]|uniref:Zinc-binding dehydrogenase n=1 Tax=Yinghuangia soli TaxID=2908204 RepID=A0AA41U5P5_9ACTN|nr:zinc-binding dehydrogenase [Yinghuangia soli]MCF2530174.1 zinc-binding dehydrogenase [Yinghuangia soli]
MAMGKSVAAEAWVAERTGKPSEVLVRRAFEVREPGPNEVRLVNEAFSLNFNDIDCIYGRYATVPVSPPFVPGMEAVGVVEAAGPGAEDLIGTRVVGIPTGALGGYSTHVVCPVSMTLLVPEHVAGETAAAMHYPFHLSWLGLYERGKLQRDETLLVTAAAGGVGSAAVQLGRLAGARVIALAGGPEKAEVCRELGADLAIDYRAEGWVEKVNEFTGGDGVDVAFDLVGGQVTTDIFRTMGFGGRHLIAGYSSGIEQEHNASFDPWRMVYGNFSLVGVAHLYSDDPVAQWRRTGTRPTLRSHGIKVHADILRLLDEGKIAPVIGRRVDFADLPDAIDALEARNTHGKVVVGNLPAV